MYNMGLNHIPVMKVVGVGGAGVNAVNRMIECGLQGVEFIAINTDAQQLIESRADLKLDIGAKITGGYGAGADPNKGREAAEAHIEDIEKALEGSKMVFITAGEGGGTGTGAAPVVARVARSLGALTVGIVTRPFSWEGKRRGAQAESGIESLRGEVDTLIIIPNDKLLDLIAQNDPGIIKSFLLCDQVLYQGVSGVTDLITTTGLINVDFEDVKTVMSNAGTAVMGIGTASGENRCLVAAHAAISSPLLECSIEGAHGVLYCIAGSSTLGLMEVSQASILIEESAHPDANIIWSTVIDDSLGDEVRVTVIAAGFDGGEPAKRKLTNGSGRRVEPQIPAAPRVSVAPVNHAEGNLPTIPQAPMPSQVEPAVKPVENTEEASKQNRYGDGWDIPNFME